MTARKKTNRKPKSSCTRNRLLPRKQANALHFETLEPKNLLAAITVGNSTDFFNAPNTSSITALMADDGGDGISLREAIAATNNTTGEDTITFDASVFTGGINNVIRLTLDQLRINDSLNIDGTSVEGVVITGDVDGDDRTISGTYITDVSASFGGVDGATDDLLDDNLRGIYFYNSTGNLTLTGLTITGSRTTEIFDDRGGIFFNSSGVLTLNQSTVSGNSTTGDFSDGGGIFAVSGSVSLTNSTVSRNSTAGYRSHGGGIFNDSGSVSLINSVVSKNSTTGNQSYGGGIFTRSGSVSLTNSVLSGNSNTGGDGIDSSSGGAVNTSTGDISLINSTVDGNSTSGTGGGISTYSGNVVLSNSTVSNNQTTGTTGSAFSVGGGISNFRGNISLTNSTISGNSTTGDNGNGGGLSTFLGSVSLINSTVSGNSTTGNDSTGGGIRTFFGSVSLTNSTISGNSSIGNGGGIFTANATVLIVSSTVTGNSSLAVGGGISLTADNFNDDERLTLRNSIVAGNTDNGTAPDSLAVGDVTNDLIVENSLIGDTTGSGVNNATGTGNILDQPALLGSLADNGGPTQTHALLSGSPAIDAGNNALAVDENGTPLATDQIGQNRLFDGNDDGTATVDIGAFEDQAIRTAGQHIFYNNSGFDSTSNSDAIATDKVALRNGETATFKNYTSYINGINGIAIDLFNPGTLTASDIGLRFGNSDDVATYEILDAGATIANLTTVVGAGVNGSDRVFIEFADGAITNGWLQVTVLANNNTGLTDDDVFYFGNVIGESGNDPNTAIVNLADAGGVRTNQTGFGLTDVSDDFDFNRDAVVNLADISIARTNQSGFFNVVNLITPLDSSAGQNDKLPPAVASAATTSVALLADSSKSKVEVVEVIEVVEVNTASTSELTEAKVATPELTTLELTTSNLPSFAVAANIETTTNGQFNGADQSDEAPLLAPLELVGAGLDTAATQQHVLDQVFETTGQADDLAVNVQLTDIDALFESSFSIDL